MNFDPTINFNLIEFWSQNQFWSQNYKVANPIYAPPIFDTPCFLHTKLCSALSSRVLCTFSTRMFCASRLLSSAELDSKVASARPAKGLRPAHAIEQSCWLLWREWFLHKCISRDLVFSLAKSWVCKVTTQKNSWLKLTRKAEKISENLKNPIFTTFLFYLCFWMKHKKGKIMFRSKYVFWLDFIFWGQNQFLNQDHQNLFLNQLLFGVKLHF